LITEARQLSEQDQACLLIEPVVFLRLLSQLLQIILGSEGTAKLPAATGENPDENASVENASDKGENDLSGELRGPSKYARQD
jgi:hypothetical protein